MLSRCRRSVCTTCVLLVVVIVAVASAAQVDDGTLSVTDRGLVSPSVNFADVLTEHNQHGTDVDTKRFPGETLAYVTPWNGHGYDMAKRHNARFTYVSPVWLQLRLDEGGRPVITGTHDIDAGWVTDVKDCAEHPDQCPQVVPRLIIEARLHKKQENTAIELITALCGEHGFDGIVLEASPLTLRRVAFVKRLSRAMRKQQGPSGKPLTLIMVTQPIRYANGRHHGIDPKVFKRLLPHVDRFSVMTYDFSVTMGRAGPNAPLRWLEYTVDALARGDPEVASKILLGMPFYGYDNGDAVVGHQYLGLLETHTPDIQWDEDSEEHFFVYAGADGATRAVYYPSLHFVQRRLELAQSKGVGVSIWEIGQGLDYFFDLL